MLPKLGLLIPGTTLCTRGFCSFPPERWGRFKVEFSENIIKIWCSAFTIWNERWKFLNRFSLFGGVRTSNSWILPSWPRTDQNELKNWDFKRFSRFWNENFNVMPWWENPRIAGARFLVTRQTMDFSWVFWWIMKLYAVVFKLTSTHFDRLVTIFESGNDACKLNNAWNWAILQFEMSDEYF